MWWLSYKRRVKPTESIYVGPYLQVSSVVSIIFSLSKNSLRNDSTEVNRIECLIKFLSQIWDTATGEPLHTFGHHHIVKCVEFSRKGQLLMTGSSNEKLLLSLIHI